MSKDSERYHTHDVQDLGSNLQALIATVKIV